MKYLFPFLLLLITACGGPDGKYMRIDFKLDAYDWDSDPYKYSHIINDSILPTKGPQYASWDYANIGNIKKMHETWDSRSRDRAPLSEEKRDSFQNFKAVNAVEYILNAAQDHQVVMINEAHHMPQHRTFTTQLLQGLKDQGYKHLGLETYFASAKNDSTLNARGYPTLKSGFYCKEPQFGNLLREAHQLGFKIFGYESEGHTNGKEREMGQAQNIKAYMEKHPGEKVLIHCGFDHSYEGEMPNKWEKAMAGRFTEYTGINPLTINQVLYSEKSKRSFENPYYSLTDVKESSVFINDENEVFIQNRSTAYMDVAIFHPRSGNSDRSQWLSYGDRRMAELNFDDLAVTLPCMVYAYKEGEEVGTAIPYDVQEATESKSVNLILNSANFNVVITDTLGNTWQTRILKE